MIGWLLACAADPGTFFAQGMDGLGRPVEEAAFVSGGEAALVFDLPMNVLDGRMLRSSDPAVAEVMLPDLSSEADPFAQLAIGLGTGVAGTTVLELVDLDTNEVLDATELVVREPTRRTLTVPDVYFRFEGYLDAGPVIVAGSPAHLQIEATDGDLLLAGGLGGGEPCEDEHWQIERHGSWVQLLARTAGLSEVPPCAGVDAMTLEVIDPTEVAALTLLARENDDGVMELFAVGEDMGGRPVLGVQPTWEGWIDDGAVGEVYRFEPSAKGTPIEVTATWGELSLETTVHQA